MLIFFFKIKFLYIVKLLSRLIFSMMIVIANVIAINKKDQLTEELIFIVMTA